MPFPITRRAGQPVFALQAMCQSSRQALDGKNAPIDHDDCLKNHQIDVEWLKIYQQIAERLPRIGWLPIGTSGRTDATP
ncbi:MAG: hypothetical protein AAF543_22225 [Pseudomonadota bacterium]